MTCSVGDLGEAFEFAGGVAVLREEWESEGQSGNQGEFLHWETGRIPCTFEMS